MDVKYTTTNKSDLSKLSITNGQIIAIRDSVGWYYDMNDARYCITDMIQVVDNLPKVGEIGKLYIFNKGLHIWDGDSYISFEDAPADTYNYIRRNNQWIRDDRNISFYPSATSVNSTNRILQVISPFLNSASKTAYFKFTGEITNNIQPISIVVPNNKFLYLDFSDINISDISILDHLFSFSIGDGSKLTIYGLTISGTCTNGGIRIDAGSSGEIRIENCDFQYLHDTPILIDKQSNTTVHVDGCNFDMNNSKYGIKIADGCDCLVSVNKCIFVPGTVTDYNESIIKANTSNFKKFQISENYIPLDHVITYSQDKIDLSYNNMIL